VEDIILFHRLKKELKQTEDDFDLEKKKLKCKSTGYLSIY